MHHYAPTRALVVGGPVRVIGSHASRRALLGWIDASVARCYDVHIIDLHSTMWSIYGRSSATPRGVARVVPTASEGIRLREQTDRH